MQSSSVMVVCKPIQIVGTWYDLRAGASVALLPS